MTAKLKIRYIRVLVEFKNMSDNPYEIITYEDGTQVARVTGYHDAFSSYCIPIGYECDGASIPTWLRWLCGGPFDEPRIIAAILHDWMYETHVVDRDVADRMYRDNLVSLGFPKWKANVEYAAIRAFGWTHWGNDEDEE